MNCNRCGQPRGQGSYFCTKGGSGGVPHFYPVENLFGDVIRGQAKADADPIRVNTPDGASATTGIMKRVEEIPAATPPPTPQPLMGRLPNYSNRAWLEARARASMYGGTEYTPPQSVIPHAFEDLKGIVSVGTKMQFIRCAQIPTRLTEMISRCAFADEESAPRCCEDYLAVHVRVGPNDAVMGRPVLSWLLKNIPKDGFPMMTTGQCFAIELENLHRSRSILIDISCMGVAAVRR